MIKEVYLPTGKGIYTGKKRYISKFYMKKVKRRIKIANILDKI